jgi:hypothetical protein
MTTALKRVRKELLLGAWKVLCRLLPLIHV